MRGIASDHQLDFCSTVDVHQIYRQHFPNAIDYLWIGDVSDTHGQHLLQTYALVHQASDRTGT